MLEERVGMNLKLTPFETWSSPSVLGLVHLLVQRAVYRPTPSESAT